MKNITLFACTHFYLRLNLISLICFSILLDFLTLNFQLHFDNYTFWDARIVPLYCTFTPCSIFIFSLTFFFLQNCIKCTNFRRLENLNCENTFLFTSFTHMQRHPAIVRPEVTKNEKSNTFTSSLNSVCSHVRYRN